MAASSSSDVLPYTDDDASIRLAMALQAEADEELVREMMMEQEQPRPTAAPHDGPTALPRNGPLPGEKLRGPAHSAIQHLGRKTAKKLEAHFMKSGKQLTLAELLRLFRGPQWEEVLMLIDPGQRERIEAELVSADLDYPGS